MNKIGQILSSMTRETILLVAVAIFGVVGLVALQVARKSPVNTVDKTLIQAEGQQENQSANAQKAIQSVPGELIRTSEDPESGKPFKFKMTKFAQGAVYELGFQDGTRKKFVNGLVSHTFHKSGDIYVTLYARFEGQEVKLDTLHKVVAKAARIDEVAPAIDY